MSTNLKVNLRKSFSNKYKLLLIDNKGCKIFLYIHKDETLLANYLKATCIKDLHSIYGLYQTKGTVDSFYNPNGAALVFLDKPRSKEYWNNGEFLREFKC